MRPQGPRSSSFFKNYGTVALGTCKGGCPRGNPGDRKAQLEGAAAGRLLSIPVAGSVAETPRLDEGAEPGLEYAPLDEDDGPVDCDCPAACYRGHRGYRSAPAAVERAGWLAGPGQSPHLRRPLTQNQALVQQLGVAAPQEEEEEEKRPPEKPVRAAALSGGSGGGGGAQVPTPLPAGDPALHL